MTKRLYWDDAYVREWSADVRETRANNTQIALDQTAFYPEGGGQPADHGTINGIAVTDVQIEDDVIWHTLAKPLPETETVDCSLDWVRRFDHMQQHHGQHLLSAAFERVCNAKTIAFHLGASATSIDLNTATMTADLLQTVEEWTNAIIWADLPIEARIVSPAELASLPLRKPPTVSGAVRVVMVHDVDYSACGGTHPRATGAVGVLHIRRIERRGDETRVEFVCGGRALRDLRWKNAAINRLSTGFSVANEQLEEAINRLREQEANTRRELERANKRLIEVDAAALIQTATIHNGRAIVVKVWHDRSLESVRALAGAIAQSGGVALFGVAGDKAQLVFADAGGGDCGANLRQVASAFGGKGGGSPTNAQGGIPDSSKLEEALTAATHAYIP